ncbi:peptidoglycan-binding protein [Streptomyces yaizuensis]|uniref:Peptidoglycan-binding protein n=1 Tax=Streptomyces yaizuensis TaxID=2989713 RepID=A0ABQ5NXX6_9ACTN|nr:peptidoglycan-binding protein [Streptomyces sp. YSPA8]GLF95234.1 peptidoglycan-binding protein [Streptomyces sp. YSPA8]
MRIARLFRMTAERGTHVGREQRGEGPGGEAGIELARMLRRWWEEAESPPGSGRRPTQQALALKLGIDQTTLSRYLNVERPSTAPLQVVETLHALLRAPAEELEQARKLRHRALRENTRRQATGGGGERLAPMADEAVSTALEQESDPAAGSGERRAPGRPGFRRLRPVLIAGAVALAFAAGMAVQERYVSPGHSSAAGAAGEGAPQGMAPLEWPVLYMAKEDYYTRGRVLQYLLNAHGFTVRTDGFFRQDTKDAVMEFQQRQGLPADGKVGRKTWPELVKEVGHGSGRFEVRAVQELLDNVGNGGTEVTGRFTSATAEDVRAFQRSEHLPVTGKVDVDTWLALLVRQSPPSKAPAYQRSAGTLPTTPA